MSEHCEPWEGYPGWIRPIVEPQLQAGETPLTWFEPDLDANLKYRQGLLVLTEQRLISFELQETTGVNGRFAATVESTTAWPLVPGYSLTLHDMVGSGRLELVDPLRRLHCWPYTSGQAAGARRIVERLDALRKGIPPSATTDAAVENIECTNCGAIFPAGPAMCPECRNQTAKPPVRSLFRLLHFAGRHMGYALLGFGLTLAGTGAGLIPPYLTMPLLDEILIPYQNGKVADYDHVNLYLMGLAGSAVLYWLLSWAQTYVTAWVSERVSAGLRTETYAHMQKLSLSYFGGKRTGDLISRVSSDTDRICYFLSVHLLDFANDLVMLILMAFILLSIDVHLALVTLCPLPVIAYLVHVVQQPAAPRLLAGQPGVGRDDVDSGRYHSGHPRGEGVCPGRPRSAALPARQRPRADGQRQGEPAVVDLWPAGGVADRHRRADHLDLWRQDGL